MVLSGVIRLWYKQSNIADYAHQPEFERIAGFFIAHRIYMPLSRKSRIPETITTKKSRVKILNIFEDILIENCESHTGETELICAIIKQAIDDITFKSLSKRPRIIKEVELDREDAKRFMTSDDFLIYCKMAGLDKNFVYQMSAKACKALNKCADLIHKNVKKVRLVEYQQA